MITAHVRIDYRESDNPIATADGTRKMLGFIERLGGKSAPAGVRPIYVAWKDQRPPSGFAFFECDDLGQLRDLLAELPNNPRVEIAEVHDLETMAERAARRLAEA